MYEDLSTSWEFRKRAVINPLENEKNNEFRRNAIKFASEFGGAHIFTAFLQVLHYINQVMNEKSGTRIL